jgi:pyruvate formate lyase activating enzyme
LFRIILRDRQYWGNQGGITLTGGEPFFQPVFAELLLKKCYDSFIHTAVETCGNIPWKDIKRSLDHLDWILYDLKHTDSHKHKQLTGTGNRLILDNARRLAKNFKGRLVFRTPIIPGFNDDEQTILRLSEFLESIGKNEINILPVHHLGREKYSLLGKDYYSNDFQIPRKENLLKIKAFFESRGIYCYLGSETPF